ncbi:hypothetical protein QR680_015563 [Steinernema hermaphroditum]|uniref:PSP proline-rich domain-containing protein n=1 Tax=Steinernema hermaphroditum TaxID=289476 RepID=A0AA39H9A5_9BILA|nr:hypothetical protein QR680_015563 [Steinernema hermaphroditum]
MSEEGELPPSPSRTDKERLAAFISFCTTASDHWTLLTPVCFSANSEDDDIIILDLTPIAERKKKEKPFNRTRAPPPATLSKRFRPGEPSPQLRAALGLRWNDIPEWIYRMRRLGFINGYPPSYLKKAIVYDDYDPTHLLSFNFIDGKLNQQEDQADRIRSFKPPTVNANKIISYGGFNKSFPELNDREGRSFIVPPFELFVGQIQKELQKKARKEWELVRQTRARQRKKFGSEETLDGQPPRKRRRLEEGELPDTDESFFEESVLIINEASVDSTADGSHPGLSTEFDCGVDVPDIATRSVNKNGDDLERFSKGIQPFAAKVDVAQSDGRFLKALLHIVKSR